MCARARATRQSGGMRTLNLEDDRRLPIRTRIVHGHLALKSRREEPHLHAAACTLLIWREERIRQHPTGNAAVHLRHRGELARLDDRRVDHVDRGHISVALAATEHGAKLAERVVVFDKAAPDMEERVSTDHAGGKGWGSAAAAREIRGAHVGPV